MDHLSNTWDTAKKQKGVNMALLSQRAYTSTVATYLFVLSIHVSYPEGPGFNIRPEDWLSAMKLLIIFISPCRQIQRHYLRLGRDSIPLHPSQSITQNPPIRFYDTQADENKCRKLAQIN
jgi:hypothetical protein